MASATLNLKHDAAWNPSRLVSKDELFEYFDIIFDFFSQPRNNMDYMLLDIYLSNFRRRIDTPQQVQESNQDFSKINSPTEITTPLDNDTIREKRLKAMVSKTYTDTQADTHSERQAISKPNNYWVSMKLPAWASQRTRELRANLLGLSLDEV
jgi:hypothetical protein